MLDAIFFLDGDSFAGRSGIEAALRRRLEPHARRWIGQNDLIALAGAAGFDRDQERRLATLEHAMREAAGERTLLIGRSSGARVATRLAMLRPVTAVVCLGYPFRKPNRPPEPERFAHLATIATPTLILQGEADPYGGRNVAEDYRLSPLVTVEFVATDHQFGATGPQWNGMAQRILAFCAALPD
jgi:predicted alpha/beta-hydrolase family hydrolase